MMVKICVNFLAINSSIGFSTFETNFVNSEFGMLNQIILLLLPCEKCFEMYEDWKLCVWKETIQIVM